ncbi:hypothetical protein ACIRQY_33905 [Streptomyces sp. NPDC101490]
MTTLRRALTALALTVLVSTGSAGVSHACDSVPAPAAGEFYCQPA